MRTTSEKSEFGSSPLTRGTLLGGCGTGKTHRFIPAYAGNSERPQSVCQRRTVHPRLRGELCEFGMTRNSTLGSSPLTRGTRQWIGFSIRPSRFIPAYAGNSPHRSNVPNSPPVHPRLRGELVCPQSRQAPGAGSSPLTRGTRRSKRSARKRFTVHPRLRGELITEHAIIIGSAGSSPLTRGTHLNKA